MYFNLFIKLSVQYHVFERFYNAQSFSLTTLKFGLLGIRDDLMIIGDDLHF